MKIGLSFPLLSDWRDWVIFDSGHEEDSLFFLMRLGYYAKTVLKRPLHLISGFRTREEQQALYDAWKSGRGNQAAVPGTSAHEWRVAVDVHGPKELWPELLKDYVLAPKYQTLWKYGLYISNWSGNSVKEWWHIQPKELFGNSCIGFLDLDDPINEGETMLKLGDNNPSVKAWQRTLTRLGTPLVEDGSFGNLTLSATKAFQKSKELAETGVVDDGTYSKALDSLLALCSDNASLKAAVGSLTSELTTEKEKSAVAETTAQTLQSHIDAYKKAQAEL